MAYNWQCDDWPNFTYDLSAVEEVLFSFVERMGRVGGLLEGLPEVEQTAAMIDVMVAEALKTSEIEGEYLSRQDVMSSIKNNLGLNPTTEQVKDQRAEGAAQLMLDVRGSYAAPLDEEKLFSWHRMLMKGRHRVNVGEWRKHAEPMQVVSGPVGKQKIHYEAPPSSRVSEEMSVFINWFNETAPGGRRAIGKALVRSAVAHVYFESIHPFEDGNGRLGRAISEKALSQGVGRPVLLSLSRTIESSRNDYYDALKEAQKSNEITSWVVYFVNMGLAAQIQAEEQIEFTLKKAKIFDRYEDQFNKRQLRVVRRMLDEGPKGFDGGMSAKKYMAITKTSKATATRDLQELVASDLFVVVGGGRSTRYELNLG